MIDDRTYQDLADADNRATETPRERHARRLLGIAALEKLLAAEKAALRAEAQGAGGFTKAGQREPVELPDGTPLGNVRVDAVKSAWKVSDPVALERWVREHAPEHIVTVTSEQVAASYIATLLEQAKGDAWLIASDTGEMYPPQAAGIMATEPSTKLVVTPDKGAPAAVRRLLGSAGSALGLREVDA